MKKANSNVLEEYKNNWQTTAGAWFPGEAVIFRGKDLFTEVHDFGWVGMILYGVTGRVFTKSQIALTESIWTIICSFPDPRLWNNRIASLAATVRSTHTLGVGASNAMSETNLFGYKPFIKVAGLLIQSASLSDDELKIFILSELKKNRVLPGYGRPLVNKDERIEPLVNAAEKLGFGDGEHLGLVFKIEKILAESRYKMVANAAAVGAALFADQGLSVDEIYRVAYPAFLGGILPCYQDASTKPEGAFFPLSCDVIQYAGSKIREW